jgi:hypothetical protein
MLLVPRDVHGPLLWGAKIPVYMQDWLTAISGKSDTTQKTVVTDEGVTQGSLAFALKHNVLGMKQGYNLPWAHLNGVHVCADVDGDKRADVIRKIIRRLPKSVSLFLTLASETDYRLFLAEGFQSAAEHNFVVVPDRLPVLHDSFSKMTKRHIKQAERELIVSTTTPETFIDIYEADLARRRRKPYSSLAIARDILKEGLRQEQARIFTAQRRDTGKIDAAIACLWDEARCYYWMTTRRLQTDRGSKPNQGAVKLLLWSAIQHAAAKGLIFDFDGAGTDGCLQQPGKTRLYHGFGAQRCIRYAVKRETRLERVVERFRPRSSF